MFTTILVQKLTKVATTNKSLGDDDDDDEDQDWTEDQEEAYAELTRAVHGHVLKDFDRRGYEHALYGVTDQALINIVSTWGAEYLNSYQGFDDTGDDGPLHNVLRMIQDGRVTDIHSVKWAYRCLEYRMAQMPAADKYLQMMGIPAPKGQLCCEYNVYNVIKEVRDSKYSTINRLILDRKVLFPRPVASQGRPFHKGGEYLVAAFHHAQTPEDIIVEKLDALVATLDQALEWEKERVNCDPGVRSKRQKLSQAFGVALENIQYLPK